MNIFAKEVRALSQRGEFMLNDINIRGGTIVTSEGEFEGTVGIQGESISYIGPEEGAPPSIETMDAGGHLVMPGMIDAHVHVRGPGFAHREDFLSATAAAAAGGVTTIAEMPVSDPPASDVKTLKDRIRHASEDALIDFCFYGGAGQDNLDAIPSLAACGIIGFKTFLMPPPEGREAEFHGLCSPDYSSLKSVCRAVGRQRLPLAVHAEDRETIEKNFEKVSQSGIGGIAGFSLSRPPLSELIAVQLVVRAQEGTNAKVIVCHVSTPEAVDCIRKAKDEGLPIFSETCPHYLLLSEEAVSNQGPFARVKPPIRPEALRDNLFRRFQNELIDILSSDHAPYLPEEKESGLDDIWQAPDGIPGLELSLPLMLEKVFEGELEYRDMVRHFSENPARLLGLYPLKGTLQLGSYADLIIV